MEAYSKMENVKGIRHALAWTPSGIPMKSSKASEGTALTEKFREGFALLSKFGLTYDCWLYHI